jgi:hypothetical protein
MAILERKIALSSLATERKTKEPPVADIDAKAFERARKDPGIRRFADEADAHLRHLKSEGRIS